MSETVPPFFTTYTRLVTETDLVATMREQGVAIAGFVRSIPLTEAGRLHAPYTWTPRQVVGHMIDTERVFGYRALRFARGDTTPLPGFHENAYASAAGSDDRTTGDLAEEFELLRRAHVLMFASMPEIAWHRRGIASKIEWTVTDLARAIIGHARHHETILRKRLSGADD